MVRKNKKKKYNKTCLAIKVTLLLVLLFLFPKNYYAADEADEPLGYTVQAIRPDTQIETNKTYFFIETKPDIAQKLRVKVKSTKKDPVKIKMITANGQTNTSGEIEYIEDPKEIDESLEHPLTEMVEFAEDEITVANFEEKIVEVTVTPPKESYQGIKLGALVFKLVEEDEGTISSKFQYRIGLITSETGEEYEDAKDLDLIKAKFALKNGEKLVTGVIQNPEPKIAKNLSIVGTVTKKGSDNVIKTKIVENARMAPNSHFDFEIDWGVDKATAGDYTLKIKASNDEEEWQWKKDFGLSKEDAEKMNKQTFKRVVLPKWVPIVVILTLTLVVIVTIILAVRSSRWQEMVKKRAKKKRNRKNKRKTRED